MRPIRPAISAARNACQPRVAETVSASDAVNDSGSEPYLRALANAVASACVKLPLISVVPEICDWMVAALTTFESRTTAVSRPMFSPVYLAQALRPSPR